MAEPIQTITRYGKPPTDQSQRRLSLMLLSDEPTWEYELHTRPEDISYTHPTRATVIQTLGGAWVDDFGEGLTDIVLSGHTGWHYAPDLRGEGNSKDGLTWMHELRHHLFEVYHERRLAAAQDGRDPDTVRLIFADTLNQAAYWVYPVSLQVRKHKSRPLLYQYQLRLIGLAKINQDADSIDWTNFDPEGWGQELLNEFLDALGPWV